MKIAEVTHVKCDETQGQTLVWIPDEWTLNDFRRAVNNAVKQYLDALQNAKEESPHPGYQPFWLDPKIQNKTVGEVRQEYESALEAYNEWEQEHNKGFLYYAEKEGMQNFWKHNLPSAIAEWGHNHGLGINFDSTIDWSSDV